MVVLRRNRPQQHRATSMKVVEITLNDVELNLSKQYDLVSVREVYCAHTLRSIRRIMASRMKATAVR